MMSGAALAITVGSGLYLHQRVNELEQVVRHLAGMVIQMQSVTGHGKSSALQTQIKDLQVKLDQLLAKRPPDPTGPSEDDEIAEALRALA